MNTYFLFDRHSLLMRVSKETLKMTQEDLLNENAKCSQMSSHLANRGHWENLKKINNISHIKDLYPAINTLLPLKVSNTSWTIRNFMTIDDILQATWVRSPFEVPKSSQKGKSFSLNKLSKIAHGEKH